MTSVLLTETLHIYAFSHTMSDVLCTFKRFHNFIFHQSARWVYLGPGVKVGSLFWSARISIILACHPLKIISRVWCNYVWDLSTL